jgi:hypothetical protein
MWRESVLDVFASCSQPRGEVEGVARPQQDVVDGITGRTQLGLVALILERELESRRIHEPALLPRYLEREDVVRVVVDGKTLRLAGREVRIGLGGMAELPLEHTAELRERRPGVVQALDDERCSRLELGEHAAHVGRAAEGDRPPGDALRI